jgi:prolyl-tRNA editing enzyme YbaK/EbsC (Cys-tRNA(Pro) deacylase)
VSAGHRGVQIVLAPADYLRATGVIIVDLTKDNTKADTRDDA